VCQCHGEHGKGDGPEAAMHDPPPSDITDARHMNTVTDGEIFYQISEGRKPMPSFKKRLTEDQRWGLVFSCAPFRSLSVPIQKKTPDAGKNPTASAENLISRHQLSSQTLCGGIFSFRLIHTFKETHAQDFGGPAIAVRVVPLAFSAPGAVRCGKLLDVRRGRCLPTRWWCSMLWHDHLRRFRVFREAPEWRHGD